MSGQGRLLQMNCAVRENERISYMGTYGFLPREVIDIEIRAKPMLPAQSRPITLRYRERMWQR